MEGADLEKLGPFLESYTGLVLRIMQQGAVAEAAARRDGSLVYGAISTGHHARHQQQMTALQQGQPLPPAPLPSTEQSAPVQTVPVEAVPTPGSADAPRTQQPLTKTVQNLTTIATVLLAFFLLGVLLKKGGLNLPSASPPPPPEATEPPVAPTVPPIPH